VGPGVVVSGVEPHRPALRPTPMRSVRVGWLVGVAGTAGAAALCVACGGSPGGGNGGTGNGVSSASCAAPYLDDVPPRDDRPASTPTASPGTTVVVYGHWYTTTCNDTGGHDPLVPTAPVHLTVTMPGGRVTTLGSRRSASPSRIPADDPRHGLGTRANGLAHLGPLFRSGAVAT